jgi:hypothetical protein
VTSSVASKVGPTRVLIEPTKDPLSAVADVSTEVATSELSAEPLERTTSLVTDPAIDPTCRNELERDGIVAAWVPLGAVGGQGRG